METTETITAETRECSKCYKAKELSQFDKNESTNTGGKKYFRPECKECRKKSQASRKKAEKNYKVNNKETYNNVRKNGGNCTLCGKFFKVLCFDHDPATDTFRGWLCDSHNRALGQLGDTVENIAKALAYVSK